MRSKFSKLKSRAIDLRKQGKTYSEIGNILESPIPKSTLSYWCKNIKLSKEYKDRIRQIIAKNVEKSRPLALLANKHKQERYIQSVRNRVLYLNEVIKNRYVAKIALAMLYLGEGSKTGAGVGFSNSNQVVIKIFLDLLRNCYNIDETKFRCTLQCRADQDIEYLEKFWSQTTNIPLSRFYKARIDPRTVGKPTRKPNYKGVCNINYFSNDIFMELKQIVEVIDEGL